jgi:hypothetical protein
MFYVIMSRREDPLLFSAKRIVRAEDIQPSYAICPCGKRSSLASRHQLKEEAGYSLTAVIRPRCRSEVRLDMVDA